MKLNVKLFRRIQKKILAEPTQFNMDWWFQDHSSTGAEPANCGTAACIGGWAVALSRKAKPSEVQHIDAFCEGSRLLGLQSQVSRDRVFLDSSWPEWYRERFRSAKTDKVAARVAAQYIDYIIKNRHLFEKDEA